MIVTEAEAKTKWCQERMQYGAANTCIGSACMAWRWVSKGAVTGHKPTDAGYQEVRSDGTGYCGKAGKP